MNKMGNKCYNQEDKKKLGGFKEHVLYNLWISSFVKLAPRLLEIMKNNTWKSVDNFIRAYMLC